MKLLPLLIAVVFCFSTVITAQDSDKEKDYIQLSDPIEQTDEYRVFGSSFNKELPQIALNDLVAKSAEFDNKTVTTEGTINKVCQKKGCFFILQSGGKMARISFQDYSFFVPTNTSGAKVKLNGTFSVKTISEKDAKHYAEDAGNDPDAIKGPQKEYALVATSVVIYK
ncbi:MAG: DUF4920 domain-containing protein [Balneolaceae bacterium]|nr:DUF4920 domain-containing protein [Balneolaceae bacterium]